jgi:hypothetical protein
LPLNQSVKTSTNISREQIIVTYWMEGNLYSTRTFEYDNYES